MTVSTNKKVLKIGSKGEIFPPKNIREELGLEPGQPIILYVHKDQLIIRKIHSLEELVKDPPKLEFSYHAWREFKDDLSGEHEK